MARLLQKFGGSSLSTLDAIASVADKIVTDYRNGHRMVVVVSAMGDHTDTLLSQANRLLAGAPIPKASLDVLMASGEQQSAALLAMAIEARGVMASALTGAQAGIKSDDAAGKASIIHVDPSVLSMMMQTGCIAVVMGFQAMGTRGQITTLGRGGSDLTAVALAAAIGVDECQIYTDVSGVFTADPRIVKSARLLDRITFQDMQALADMGAQVLQSSSVQYASTYNVPIRVRSAFMPTQGTLIMHDDGCQPMPMACAADENQTWFCLQTAHLKGDMPIQEWLLFDHPGSVDIYQDAQYTHGIVRTADWQSCLSRINHHHPHAITGLRYHHKIAKISLLGNGLKRHKDVLSYAKGIFAEAGISIEYTFVIDARISFLVDEAYTELALRMLHDHIVLSSMEASST